MLQAALLCADKPTVVATDAFIPRRPSRERVAKPDETMLLICEVIKFSGSGVDGELRVLLQGHSLVNALISVGADQRVCPNDLVLDIKGKSKTCPYGRKRQCRALRKVLIIRKLFFVNRI
jgi:hypothetical protein